MRRTSWVRWAVVGAVGLLVLSFGLRVPLRGGQPTAAIALTAVSGAFGGGQAKEDEEPAKVVHVPAPPMSPEATRVWLKLQDKVSMNFPTDTPLEDIKKYIERSTQDEKVGFPTGIPIYVDPQGLQDADKTMASTVVLNLEGMPLALTLQLLLKQLNLGYYVHKDGLLVITSHDAEQITEGSTRILDELASLRTEVQLLRREIRACDRAARPRSPNLRQKAPVRSDGAIGDQAGASSASRRSVSQVNNPEEWPSLQTIRTA